MKKNECAAARFEDLRAETKSSATVESGVKSYFLRFNIVGSDVRTNSLANRSLSVWYGWGKK